MRVAIQFRRGDDMKERLRAFIFVTMLGVLLPSILLRILIGEVKPVVESETKEKETEDLAETVAVIHADGGVEEMFLEEYVVSVVLAEMPAEFAEEALKAQAVIARTYALKRQITADKHDGAVCTDSTCCQGYCDQNTYSGGLSMLQKVRHAVAETKGKVLCYDGQLIEATYFSCSGGKTEAAVAVWGNDIPYLRSIDSPGEEGSNHYISTVRLDRGEVMGKLGLNGEKITISNISYTDGGGVAEICICGKTFTGVQIRQLLELKSTAFRVSVLGDHVLITTKGYGHRVGMSQYGADAMAEGGSTYIEILRHYYEGTELSEISQQSLTNE